MTSFRYQHPVTLHCQYFPPEDTRKNALQLSRHANQRNMPNEKLLSRHPPIHRQHNENSTHIDDAPLSSGRSVGRSEAADVEEGIGSRDANCAYVYAQEGKESGGRRTARREPPSPAAADSASKGEKTLLPRLPSQPKARKYFPFPPSFRLVWLPYFAVVCPVGVLRSIFLHRRQMLLYFFQTRGNIPFPIS